VREELQNLELCVLAVTKSPLNFNFVREEIKTTEFFTQLKAYYNNNIKVEGNNIVFTIAGKGYKYFLTNNYKQLKELSKYINKVHSDNQIKTETETKPDIRKLLANIKDLTAADNKAITYLSKEIYKTLEELVTIKPNTNTNTKTEVENNNFTFGGDESEYESEYESRNESEYELRNEPRIIESRDGFQIIEWGGEFQLIYLGQASN
jgi:hypothetical protein